jgi:hypothetical protein
MKYKFAPTNLSPCTLISDDEVLAARKRLTEKHGLAYAARRGWLVADNVDKITVALRIVRKEGVFGKFAQLWQSNTLIREAYIYPTAKGEYRSVHEFVAEAKRDYLIENLPMVDDPRYYVRQLAVHQSMGTMSMGCLTENGEIVECYTVDDLIAIGFA